MTLNRVYASLEYTISRTALGADQTAVIPDFTVRGASLQSLYIYSVKFQYNSGPELENAKVGIDLSSPTVRPIGKIVPEGPAEVFRISCGPFEKGAKSTGAICSVGRLSSTVGAFTLSFATDTDVNIRLSIDAKNTQVKQTGITGTGTPGSQLTWFTLAAAVILVPLGVLIGYFFGKLLPNGAL